jgi:hypothetical protein
MKRKKAVYILFVVSAVFSIIFAGCSPSKIKEPEMFVIELLMARSFHAPIKISIVGGESTADLKAEIYSGVGGGEWGAVERVIELDIDKETFLELYERVFALNFDEVFAADWEHGGVDGSSWELRAGLGGSISLRLWSPTSETKERGLGEFVSICESLLALSGINIPEEELY